MACDVQRIAIGTQERGVGDRLLSVFRDCERASSRIKCRAEAALQFRVTDGANSREQSLPNAWLSGCFEIPETLREVRLPGLTRCNESEPKRILARGRSQG